MKPHDPLSTSDRQRGLRWIARCRAILNPPARPDEAFQLQLEAIARACDPKESDR